MIFNLNSRNKITTFQKMWGERRLCREIGFLGAGFTANRPPPIFRTSICGPPNPGQNRWHKKRAFGQADFFFVLSKAPSSTLAFFVVMELPKLFFATSARLHCDVQRGKNRRQIKDHNVIVLVTQCVHKLSSSISS